jgi:hypothetical protein
LIDLTIKASNNDGKPILDYGIIPVDDSLLNTYCTNSAFTDPNPKACTEYLKRDIIDADLAKCAGK